MNKISAIALSTFRESIRSKVMFTVLFFAVAVVAVSALFGSVTIGDQVKVIKDFGLFSISLFSTLFATISGTALLHKELSRRTIFNILAKSVTRWEFLLGKYVGMLLTVAAMIICMSLGLGAFLFLFEGRADPLILQACLHIFFELMVLCASAIFFSSIVVTPLLAGAFTFAVFLAGRSTEFLLYFAKNEDISGVAAWLCRAIYQILPHLDKINVSDALVYGKAVPFAASFAAFGHALTYSAILLILANLIFKNREFN